MEIARMDLRYNGLPRPFPDLIFVDGSQGELTVARTNGPSDERTVERSAGRTRLASQVLTSSKADATVRANGGCCETATV